MFVGSREIIEWGMMNRVKGRRLDGGKGCANKGETGEENKGEPGKKDDKIIKSNKQLTEPTKPH